MNHKLLYVAQYAEQVEQFAGAVFDALSAASGIQLTAAEKAAANVDQEHAYRSLGYFR